MTMTKPSPTPQLDALAAEDPDLVDRIFDYLLKFMPGLPQLRGAQLDEAKRAVRDEFASQRVYIAQRPSSAREEVARQVLEKFNGRNATEVARELKISRATVYRLLKQPGRQKTRLSFAGNETGAPVGSRKVG